MLQVSKEQFQIKLEDIDEADNYNYREGEAEGIALKKFERALKLGDLHEFPNVTYFHKKKLLERQRKIDQMETAKNPLEKDRVRHLVEKLDEDIKAIEKFLQKDTRISRAGGQASLTIEEIEKEEAQKNFYIWLEQQEKEGDNRKETIHLKQNLNEKEQVYLEI